MDQCQLLWICDSSTGARSMLAAWSICSSPCVRTSGVDGCSFPDVWWLLFSFVSWWRRKGFVEAAWISPIRYFSIINTR
jgi:hypothetical protein